MSQVAQKLDGMSFHIYLSPGVGLLKKDIGHYWFMCVSTSPTGDVCNLRCYHYYVCHFCLQSLAGSSCTTSKSKRLHGYTKTGAFLRCTLQMGAVVTSWCSGIFRERFSFVSFLISGAIVTFHRLSSTLRGNRVCCYLETVIMKGSVSKLVWSSQIACRPLVSNEATLLKRAKGDTLKWRSVQSHL